MTDAARWLDEREPPAPRPVREAVDRLLAAVEPGPALPDHFADAALRGLAAVIREPSRRSTAHVLLAADALLTYACEAAAEAGPEELERVTRRLDLEQLSHLMTHAP